MPETIRTLKGKRKITALTAYDYSMAKILSRAGVDILLVGDSLGMVVLGYRNTHFVTLDDMIRHGQAVVRGNKGSLVVIDMPIGTCDTPEKAVENCRRACEETGARTVKIEGKAESVRAVCQAGISVMGHTGLKPQEVTKYTVQGGDSDSRKRVLDEAKALESAGAFSLILECVPSDLGREVTELLSIPVIGIGAGPHADGQILVSHDMLGFSSDIRPRFVRRYADLSETIFSAVKRYNEDVRNGDYPAESESY
ncbi:3-methyl-2-oxobutanoate hydroxymethyltransferase [Candidatus Peregrinibacteria bacterium]|nr:3-methyl-2-oxobutanoate hydroxymethyltransferase [Candidatus Peregrinibacteria bacterium]